MTNEVCFECSVSITDTKYLVRNDPIGCEDENTQEYYVCSHCYKSYGPLFRVKEEK